jgi:hypothetical protein
MTASATTRFCLRVPIQVQTGVTDEDFIPVLQGWIQREALPWRLIDVAYYGHVSAGPVVLLCGHEANLAVERSEGGYSLEFQSKFGDDGKSMRERIARGFELVESALSLLEADSLLEGTVRAVKGRAEFISNDRLAFPNTPKAFEEIREELENGALAYLGAGVKAAVVAGDPRERLTVELTSA